MRQPQLLSQQDKDKIKADVEKFFSEADFAGLYSAESKKVIEESAVERCVEDAQRLGLDHNVTIKKMRNILLGEPGRPSRKDLIKYIQNLQRQQNEVKKYDANPAAIDWPKMVEQMWGRIPLSVNGHERVRLNKIAYGADVQNNPMPLHLRDKDKPIIHAKPLHKNGFMDFGRDDYYKELEAATKTIEGGLKANSERLKAVLEGRKDLSFEEENAIILKSQDGTFAKAAKAAGRRAHAVSQALGKGMWSNSDAKEDSRFRSHVRKRNAMVADLLQYLDQSKVGSAHLMKMIDQNLEGVFDDATFKEITNWIAAKMKAEDAENSEAIKKYTEEMQKVNGAMLEAMKKHVSEEDTMWKFRALQLFLLISPFAAFSAFGAIFNYINPLSQLVTPIFTSGHVASGIGSIVSSPVFGPIGDLFQAIKLDTAVTWLLDNVPIVNNVCEVFDVLNNAVFSNVVDVLMPLLGSPLLPLGIGLGYSAHRLANKEFPHYFRNWQTKKNGEKVDIVKENSSVEKTIADHEEKLEKLSNDFAEAMETKSPAKIRDLVEKKYALLERSDRCYQIAKHIENGIIAGPGEAQKIFDNFVGVKFEFKKQQKTLEEIYKESGNVLDKETAIGLTFQLNKSAEEVNPQEKANFDLFQAAATRAIPQKKSHLEFMKKVAIAKDFDDSELNAAASDNEIKAACNAIEDKAKRSEIEHILEAIPNTPNVAPNINPKNILPNGKVANPSAGLLNRLNGAQQTLVPCP